MKKYIAVSIILLLCLGFGIVIKVGIGYRPYKNLSETDLSCMYVVYGGLDPYELSEDEVQEVINALRDIILYGKKASQVSGEGAHNMMFILNYKDGRSEIVAVSVPDFYIDFVMYSCSRDEGKVLYELWKDYVVKYILK